MKKYVLVTGGSNGIGAAICQKLQKGGYDPIIFDIEKPANNEGITFYKVDLSDAKETKRILEDICNQFEILRLVNNVGIVKPASIEDTTVEEFEHVFTLNAQSSMLCVQALLPAMRKAQFGRIVSVTSRALLGKELRTSYSASKGALGAMSRTWALELAPDGITVNTIAPGPIGTKAFFKNNPPEDKKTKNIINKIPVNRIGTPMDVAHGVKFFLEEESGFITGQTLYVCGGITIGLRNE